MNMESTILSSHSLGLSYGTIDILHILYLTIDFV